MTKQEFLDLLDKYLEGKCQEEERQLLEKFYDGFQQGTAWEKALGDELHLQEDILLDIRKKIQSAEKVDVIKERSWIRPMMRVAASILVLLSLAYWFYQNDFKSDLDQVAIVEKLTDQGQKSTVVLSDGTTIRLNSSSRLSFPEKFAKDKREITLEGEAFFDVARDEKRPFIIKSGDISTTVLGTSFNVKAFDREDVQVTVATGKVKVENTTLEADGFPLSVTLTSHQQVNCDLSSGTLEKKSVDIEPYLAWKDGVIRFNNVSLVEAVSVLERWYGVEISLENESIKNCRISNGTYQDENLYNVLKSFEYFLDIEFEMLDSKHVEISGLGCK